MSLLFSNTHVAHLHSVFVSNNSLKFLHKKCATTQLKKIGKCVSVAIFSLFALTSCGFQPIYAEPEAGNAQSEMLNLLSHIAVSGPDSREGNVLVAEIEGFFNPQGVSVSKDYQLEVDLDISEQDLVILEDATASRKRVNLTSAYRLVRMADDALVDSGTVTYSNSYAAQDDANYASYTVKRDIRFRALTELAERYKLRMAGLFSSFSN